MVCEIGSSRRRVRRLLEVELLVCCSERYRQRVAEKVKSLMVPVISCGRKFLKSMMSVLPVIMNGLMK